MSDLDNLAVDSNTPSAASVLSDSSSSNASSVVSKQLPQSAVDAWNVTFKAAKLSKTAQDTGWQPVSPNPWPAEAASLSNAQPSAQSARPQWLPLGGTYDPKTDTWEHTQGAASDILPNAPTGPTASKTAPGASFAGRFDAVTPAQTAGGTSVAAGATAKAPHFSAIGSTGATPSPIDPESLPPGPLNKADYETVGERNRYLASKYDPNNLYDRFINSFTGAMNDPANVRTPSEQAEHEALSQKIFDTVFRQPTVAEARLNMMAASPIGAMLSVFTGAKGSVGTWIALP